MPRKQYEAPDPSEEVVYRKIGSCFTSIAIRDLPYALKYPKAYTARLGEGAPKRNPETGLLIAPDGIDDPEFPPPAPLVRKRGRPPGSKRKNKITLDSKETEEELKEQLNTILLKLKGLA